MTLLQANLEHARRVKKREKIEARRTALATRIIAAQREEAKAMIAAQRRSAAGRIGGGEERKRIGGKGEGKILQIESGEEEKGEEKVIELTDEIRQARRARGTTVIEVGNKKAGEAAKERRVIELAKSFLRPLPQLPPEPKPRRKNK